MKCRPSPGHFALGGGAAAQHVEQRRGALAQVLPGWEPRREIIHAVYASRRGQLPAVRALLDHLAQQFKALQEE